MRTWSAPSTSHQLSTSHHPPSPQHTHIQTHTTYVRPSPSLPLQPWPASSSTSYPLLSPPSTKIKQLSIDWPSSQDVTHVHDCLVANLSQLPGEGRPDRKLPRGPHRSRGCLLQWGLWWICRPPRHKPTKLAYSLFLFCSSVYFCLYDPVNALEILCDLCAE